MVILIILAVIVIAVLWFRSETKPKDSLMSSIFSGEDFPNCGVYESKETGKYYLAPYALRFIREKLEDYQKNKSVSSMEQII